MRLLLLLLMPLAMVWASLIKAPLFDVDADQGLIKITTLQEGVSGFVVRRFNDEHSAIIAKAVVVDVDAKNKQATVAFSAYEGLKQNALPKGEWHPKEGDEVQLAFAYNRALLLAPSREIYYQVTSRGKNIAWVSSDLFAAMLSERGHPTPLQEDIQDFCDVATVGLLYIYAKQTLFTLDCHSFQVLQTTPLTHKVSQDQRPFYSRIETIREAWWGDGSAPMKAYEPYYFHLIEQNNQSNTLFQQWRKSQPASSKEF